MSASIRAKRAEEQHREDGGVGKRLKVSCLHHIGGADVGDVGVKNQQSLSIVTLYECLQGHYVYVQYVSENFHSSAVCLSSSGKKVHKGYSNSQIHYPESISCLISHFIEFCSLCMWRATTGDMI